MSRGCLFVLLAITTLDYIFIVGKILKYECKILLLHNHCTIIIGYDLVTRTSKARIFNCFKRNVSTYVSVFLFNFTQKNVCFYLTARFL